MSTSGCLPFDVIVNVFEGSLGVVGEVLDGKVTVERGTLSDALARQWGQGRASWVVTNILAHVIVEFFEQGLARALSLGGWLILSGILRSQTPAIYACLAGSGLELLAQERQEEWVCVIARRAHGKGEAKDKP